MDPTMLSMLMQMLQGGGGGKGYGPSQGGQGLGGGNPFGDILSSVFGMFGGDPYKKGFKEYEKYMNKGIGAQQPFYDAGVGGLHNYEDWLKKMKDPTGFVNDISSKYQESPYAKVLQEQAMRSAQNQGSASGMTGSTPLTKFAQQNAHDISSQDQDKWLQNALGVNTQYGEGQHNLAGMGQNSANMISQLMQMLAQGAGNAGYGSQQYGQQKWTDLFHSIFK